MSKTDLRNRVLNDFYPDKHNPNERILGSEIQVRAAMPWIGPNPTVFWSYQLRCLVPEDQAYVTEQRYPADTLFAGDLQALFNDRYAYRRFKIPPHGGIQYSLYARLGTGGTQLVKQFTTWRRIYIDLVAQRTPQVQCFQRALPFIVAAFAEAYIEVVLSKITVGQQQTQASQNPHADRNGTTTVAISLKDETEDVVHASMSCRFRKAQGGLVLEQVNGNPPNQDPARPRMTMEGMRLQIQHSFPKTQWDPTPHVFREVRFENAQGTAIGPSGNWLPRDEQQRPVAPPDPLHKIVQRVDARTLHINLGHAAVGPWLGALPVSETFTLFVKLQFLAFGGNRGGAVARASEVSISFAPERSAQDIACTVVHELGHILDLTVPTETKANGQKEVNPLYYEGHGGAGPHCKHNVQNPAAPDGVPYKPPDNNNRLCVMYHATVSEKMNQARFCATCLGHLRRRSVPAMPMRPRPAAPVQAHARPRPAARRPAPPSKSRR